MIATALALPLTVVLAFVFTTDDAKRTTSKSTSTLGSTSPSVLTPVSVTAPPSASPSTEAACVKVLAALPVQLTPSLAPRRVLTDSSLVRAWGDPAIVLRCGVPIPVDLAPANGESLVAINDVNWLPVQSSAATVFTSVDRAVGIEVVVPKASVDQPMALIADAVKVLPPTCTTIDAAGNHTSGLPVCGAAK